MCMRSALVLISFFSLTNFSFCQNDTIFPNNGASWYVKSWTYDDPGIQYGHYECEILTDTFDSLGYTWSTMRNGQNDTIGWVAVDSGKVFFRGHGQLSSGLGHLYDADTIMLVYDFNLEVGDTINYAFTPMVVQSISISNFLGTPKRVFELSSGNGCCYDSWIEGMGSTEGFFRPAMTFFELGFILCSFNGHYVDSLSNNYDLSYDSPFTCEQLSAEENKMQSPPLFGSDWIQVNLSDKNQIQIYSVSGALVHAQEIPAGSFRADLSFLKDGIYLIQIGSDQSYRFVKY